MKLSTKGIIGKTTKSITVKINDPNRSHFKLSLMGEVIQFAVINPARVMLRGMMGETLSQVVTVAPGTEEPFEILETSAMRGEDFKYSMTETEVDGKKTYQFLIENLKTSPGRYLDQVTIITDKAEHNPIIITVNGDIRPLGVGTGR
jgi:hypothetical protein